MLCGYSISQRSVSTVAVNPTGEWLAFGCSSVGQLLVWEWRSETYILKQQGHFYDMNVLAYSPDGQYIVTGGDDGKVYLTFTFDNILVLFIALSFLGKIPSLKHFCCKYI